MVWSNEYRVAPIAPDDEARRIFHLLHHPHDRIAGKHLHPPLGDEHVVAHNLAVALLLQRVEQQGTAPDREDAEHAERTP